MQNELNLDQQKPRFPVVSEGNIGRDNIQTVNARDLHEFLEVATRFNDWIVARIKEYGFAENRDFVTFTENSVKGRPSKEYAVSLDMAKELAMVERNEQGKQARQYFIECERRVNQPRVIDLNDPGMLRGLLANYAERTEIAEAALEDARPKVEAFDRLDACEGSLGLRVAAKTLGYPERKLARWLEVNGWAYRQNGRGPLQAYAQRRKDGYLDHKLTTYQDPATGEEKVKVSLMITPKGMARLAKLLPKDITTH